MEAKREIQLQNKIYEDEELFKKTHIAPHRGKPIFLIRFEFLKGTTYHKFAEILQNEIHFLVNTTSIDFGFFLNQKEEFLLLAISPFSGWSEHEFPNLDNAVGKFLDYYEKHKKISFRFGIGRTACNFISESDEIYQELYTASKKNLDDNLTRWKWTFLNRANTYLSSSSKEAVIQPTIYFHPQKKTFSVVGGEVFIGGGLYHSYKDLIKDIPSDQNIHRFELLILEKLILASEGCKGTLKFNISPESFIEIFKDLIRVKRFHGLVKSRNLEPKNIRIELIEKPFEEKDIKLKEVCKFFWDYGFSFSADDFGVRSQSHQVVLELGLMIKEIKLDPLSFQYKKDEDQIKFLDNLAFIDYCQHLANNRDAIITAEAVEDIETLQFLIERKIYYFQTNLLCGKMSIPDYKKYFEIMQDLPFEVFQEIYYETPKKILRSEKNNVFLLYHQREQKKEKTLK
ncbi:MAG: EAL domain-containing protein [Leptospiraceae bacterium]|nr:EAL domain-containing protein [Leptospiraceae bacterium]MDW7976370.1 EAL domain-containing protein [Leptospiraceae bacterium]